MHPFELLKRQLDEMAKTRQVEQAKEEAAARELRKAQADLSLDVLHPFCWTMKWNSP